MIDGGTDEDEEFMKWVIIFVMIGLVIFLPIACNLMHQSEQERFNKRQIEIKKLKEDKTLKSSS